MSISVASLALPYESCPSRFVVFHSTSETVFVPCFSEENELVAHMFAEDYARRRGSADYSERAQIALVDSLYAFLRQVFPLYQETFSQLPAAWNEELNASEHGDDLQAYTAWELLDWYHDGDERANVAQGAFNAWRTAELRKVG